MDKKKVLIALIVLGLLLSIFTLNAGAHYVGSKNLDVYHYPSCHYVDQGYCYPYLFNIFHHHLK